MLEPFVSSAVCRTRTHCKQCRDPSPEGRKWRLKILKHWSAESPDWDCPHGVEWGSDPGESAGRPPSHAPNRISRPGDLVSMIIAALGVKLTRNCGCEAKRRQMNEWGWWGCWRRRAELVDWFSQKAKEAGVTVERESVSGLIRAAIREALRTR